MNMTTRSLIILGAILVLSLSIGIREHLVRERTLPTGTNGSIRVDPLVRENGQLELHATTSEITTILTPDEASRALSVSSTTTKRPEQEKKVAQLPDLVIDSVTVTPRVVTKLQLATLTVTVRNIGNAPADDPKLLTLFQNTATGRSLGGAGKYPILPGQTWTYSMNVDAQNMLCSTAGISNPIIATVDATHAVDESNEENNTYDLSIICGNVAVEHSVFISDSPTPGWKTFTSTGGRFSVSYPEHSLTPFFIISDVWWIFLPTDRADELRAKGCTQKTSGDLEKLDTGEGCWTGANDAGMQLSVRPGTPEVALGYKAEPITIAGKNGQFAKGGSGTSEIVLPLSEEKSLVVDYPAPLSVKFPKEELVKEVLATLRDI